MKQLFFLPLLLLASCSGGDKLLELTGRKKIVTLSCTYDSVKTSPKNDLVPKESEFTFDSSTGEAYEYSDFYEKLVLTEGISKDKQGGIHKFESIIVNKFLKIDSSYKPKPRPGESPEPDLYEYRINLKDLSIKEKYVSGIGKKYNYTATGSCKYTKPKSTKIHRDIQSD